MVALHPLTTGCRVLIPLRDLVREYGVRPGPVLHVGAHRAEELGDYRREGFGPVWWVEGNPDLIPTLRLKVAMARHHVVHAVLADRERDVTFHVASNGQSSSILPLGTHATEHPEVTYVAERAVRTTTIDTLSAAGALGQDPAPFLNLDVQGAELDVLKGGERYLAGVRWVYTEVNEKELYTGCALLPEMDAWLEGRGFVRVAAHLLGHGWGDALYVRSQL